MKCQKNIYLQDKLQEWQTSFSSALDKFWGVFWSSSQALSAGPAKLSVLQFDPKSRKRRECQQESSNIEAGMIFWGCFGSCLLVSGWVWEGPGLCWLWGGTELSELVTINPEQLEAPAGLHNYELQTSKGLFQWSLMP